MDGMKKIRGGLFTGMKDFARQSRMAKLKKRYGSGIPAIDKSMEEGDEAIEAAELPEVPKKKGGSVVTISIEDMKGDMDRWADEGGKALREIDEDEEEKKFFRGTGR